MMVSQIIACSCLALHRESQIYGELVILLAVLQVQLQIGTTTLFALHARPRVFGDTSELPLVVQMSSEHPPFCTSITPRIMGHVLFFIVKNNCKYKKKT
jgi:hypothetical protein